MQLVDQFFRKSEEDSRESVQNLAGLNELAVSDFGIEERADLSFEFNQELDEVNVHFSEDKWF